MPSSKPSLSILPLGGLRVCSFIGTSSFSILDVQPVVQLSGARYGGYASTMIALLSLGGRPDDSRRGCLYQVRLQDRKHGLIVTWWRQEAEASRVVGPCLPLFPTSTTIVVVSCALYAREYTTAVSFNVNGYTTNPHTNYTNVNRVQRLIFKISRFAVLSSDAEGCHC